MCFVKDKYEMIMLARDMWECGTRYLTMCMSRESFNWLHISCIECKELATGADKISSTWRDTSTPPFCCKFQIVDHNFEF